MNDVERMTAYRKLQALKVTTIRQAIALLAINYQAGISTVELAKVINTNRQSASELAKQLKLKGLIDWHISDLDQRQVGRRKDSRVYYLTQQGQQAIEQAR